MQDNRLNSEVASSPMVSAGGFVAAVEQFCALLQNPSLPLSVKSLAWDRIVRDAAKLDPHQDGFERAGVALKGALSLWIDVRSTQPRCDTRLAA